MCAYFYSCIFFLQETVETAQEKLAALVASFSEREINIETHLNNVKVTLTNSLLVHK